MNPERDGHPAAIQAVIEQMDAIAQRLGPEDARRHFHAVYLRTTRAVGEELELGGFVDPAWVAAWDVAFANLYIDAFGAWERGVPCEAWEVPFSAARDRPDLQPLRHVLLGMNVHINFDLPLALLAVISDADFGDADRVGIRERDHLQIDTVLGRRIAAEDRALPGRSVLDRLLSPLNRRASRTFLLEARDKVWRNTRVLAAARLRGPDALALTVAELDRLCAARAADLVAPGQVILELSRRGFGVLLPGA